jgi:hypothetical protein
MKASLFRLKQRIPLKFGSKDQEVAELKKKFEKSDPSHQSNGLKPSNLTKNKFIRLE